METKKTQQKSKKEVKIENKNIVNFKEQFRHYISIKINCLLEYHRAILLFSIFIIIFIKFYNKKDIENFNKTDLNEKNKASNNIGKNPEDIIINQTIDYLHEEENITEPNNQNITDIINNVNKYINICNEGIILVRLKNNSSYPKITSLTASYNSKKTIKAAIRSIQNQKMKDIEILIIDDASTDGSLDLIKELQKEDNRIKIIENKENMGPLYSKSIGALQAKGKYIMQLDSDDLFINENIFNICYDEAEKNNIDIIEFSGFRSKSKYLNISEKPKIPRYLRYKEHNLTIYQPELSNFIYEKKGNKIIKLIDGYLWGKCIKSEVYRKSLDTLGEDIYTKKIFYGDDRIVNFILFRTANSFKFIQEFGIIYYSTPHSILNSRNKYRNCHDELFNIMNIFNFTKDSNDSSYAFYELNYRWKKLIVPGLNKNNSVYARNLIIQMRKCKYISKRDKSILYGLWMNRNK